MVDRERATNVQTWIRWELREHLLKTLKMLYQSHRRNDHLNGIWSENNLNFDMENGELCGRIFLLDEWIGWVARFSNSTNNIWLVADSIRSWNRHSVQLKRFQKSPFSHRIVFTILVQLWFLFYWFRFGNIALENLIQKDETHKQLYA